jgi:CopG family nickel-responsive transcriptional regulator
LEKILRKGIAFDPEQLKIFDSIMKSKGYKNRSEAIRDLIRNSLVEEKEHNPNSTMIGTLTIVYSHHEHDVQHELTHLEHHAGNIIRSGIHIHIDDQNCLEVLILQGKVSIVKNLADNILATKGVKHGKLFLTST